MYCIYGNSSWYIHSGLLFGEGLLLGGSVIGGSTVYGIARCMRTSTYCAVHLYACIDSVHAGLLLHLASLSQAFSWGFVKKSYSKSCREL